MAEHGHLRRLARIWISQPVFFVTVCTHGRNPILTLSKATDVLRREWESAKKRHGWLIGRYVVMPDHVHFFCAEKSDGSIRPLAQFMDKWKEWTAKGICAGSAVSAPVWQKGFFDHLMRSDESYADKWAYVRNNPVRAGLAATWEAWPGQGFVDFDSPL